MKIKADNSRLPQNVQHPRSGAREACLFSPPPCCILLIREMEGPFFIHTLNVPQNILKPEASCPYCKAKSALRTCVYISVLQMLIITQRFPSMPNGPFEPHSECVLRSPLWWNGHPPCDESQHCKRHRHPPVLMILYQGLPTTPSSLAVRTCVSCSPWPLHKAPVLTHLIMGGGQKRLPSSTLSNTSVASTQPHHQ